MKSRSLLTPGSKYVIHFNCQFSELPAALDAALATSAPLVGTGGATAAAVTADIQVLCDQALQRARKRC